MERIIRGRKFRNDRGEKIIIKTAGSLAKTKN